MLHLASGRWGRLGLVLLGLGLSSACSGRHPPLPAEAASVLPQGQQCPADYRVKVSAAGWLALPTAPDYRTTVPVRCYATTRGALTAGASIRPWRTAGGTPTPAPR